MESSNSKRKEESVIPMNESFNFNQEQIDIFPSSIHSSVNQKQKNIKYRMENDLYFDKDIDPNFKDIKLIKEEEERRRKAVEDFEKRKLKKNKDNNIIDYDDIFENKNKDKINKDDTQVEDEGIIIDNFNYMTKPKINNISHKNSIHKKNNEFEDLESKITQIKHISSYSKDDLNINITPDKIKKENIKFKNNNIIKNINNLDTKVDIIKESDINSYTNLDINESNYNMNFYDTLRKSTNENSKNSQGVFESLLPNKSFKKFLKDKIKYYMDEKDIPANFIKNLYSGNEIGSMSQSNGFHSNNYSNYKSVDNEKLNMNIYANDKINNNKSMDLFRQNKKISNTNYNKNNNYKKIFNENKINKKKLEEMRKELNEQKNEMNEKVQKINLLENINDNLKQEMNKLQKNFENERIDNTQNRKNFAMIKNYYNDIKNQYELLNMKYMTLNDENFNFRRNKELYERQIAIKNEMIENLIENKTTLQKQKVNNKLDKINLSTKSSQKIISNFIKDNKENSTNEVKNNNSNITKESNRANQSNKIDYSKYNKLSFPDLQCKRDELNRERRDINNIYSKIPLKTYNRELINKKIDLEKRMKEINCELMLVKLSIKNYKSHK